MAGRRRSISTDISTDVKIAALAAYGPLPCLLYTWAIPHADDFGRLSAAPLQFKLLVCPSLALTCADIEEAIRQIEECGLWSVEDDLIQFPLESWFKYQSYIPTKKREKASPTPQNEENRRKTAENAEDHRDMTENAEDHRKSAKNAVSLSPSPSPSLNNRGDMAEPTPAPEGECEETPGRDPQPEPLEFHDFWNLYPVKTARGAALREYKRHYPTLDRKAEAIKALRAQIAAGKSPTCEARWWILDAREKDEIPVSAAARSPDPPPSPPSNPYAKLDEMKARHQARMREISDERNREPPT